VELHSAGQTDGGADAELHAADEEEGHAEGEQLLEVERGTAYREEDRDPDLVHDADEFEALAQDDLLVAQLQGDGPAASLVRTRVIGSAGIRSRAGSFS